VLEQLITREADDFGDLTEQTTAKGRVENRLSPALPHQTVHAVFPHTAFLCFSH
jgi:hypothetical protein